LGWYQNVWAYIVPHNVWSKVVASWIQWGTAAIGAWLWIERHVVLGRFIH
jgi:hypothetical protein